MERIRVIQIGMGSLGRQISTFIPERNDLQLVSAIDNDPALVGQDLDALCSGVHEGLIISDRLKDEVKKKNPDVALLTTVSELELIAPQIEAIVSLGIPVISTCEELVYPWKTAPELARGIDETAKRGSVAVLSTGVNPGFLMDTLPLCLSAVCRRVDGITVSRIQDAGLRRIPFQKKIGVSLTLEEFERERDEGRIGHVGLGQSLHMIADGLGWELKNIEETLIPVVAEGRIETVNGVVERGRLTGIQQIGKGYVRGEEKITLLFRASLCERDPKDSIEIRGVPNIVSTVEGGVNGDIATGAIILNAISRIVDARPGLRTMIDMPIVFHNKVP
jgi:4-hydroxy-tetrahydrodipicolinate reductase